MHKSFSIILSLFVLFFIFSCGEDEKVIKEIKPGFEKYISGFTSGTQLSRGTNFTIRFQKSINDSIRPGQKLEKEVLHFKPSIKGKAIWLDSRTIEFIPDQLLESGTTYNVSLNLGYLMEVPEEFSSLNYSVRTLDQAFRVINEGLEAYEDDLLRLKYSGKIITADIAEAEEVEKMVDAELFGNSVALRWNHHSNLKIHQFFIDSIERVEESHKLKISLDGSSIGLDNEEDYDLKIPGQNEFEVLSIQAYPGKREYVDIRFSDPLLKGQDLVGLVHFESNVRMEYIIEGNRLKIYPAGKLTGEQQLHISEGVKNAMGYQLKSEHIFPILFESIKPALQLVGNGVIVPSSDGLIFPFKAVSLKMVDLEIIKIYENNVLDFLQNNNLNNRGDIKLSGRLIFKDRIDLSQMTQANLSQWNTFKIDLANYVRLDPGVLYRVKIDFRRSYSVYSCDGEEAPLLTDEEYKAEVAEEMKRWDMNRYYWDYGSYDWRERENPCNDSYYRYKSISQNLFASNLGITAKGTPNNKYAVVISDLTSTDPVSGAEVEFYSLQKQLIRKSKTNSLGIAIEQLPSKPYFVVAKKDKERGYLKLDNGDALSLSNFNVSGMIIQDGLKAFIYGERGVWRPGDTIYLTAILEDIENRLPADHPVMFDLINPMGQVMVHQVKRRGENGFYSFIVSTDVNAPTGNWTAQVKVGGAVFSRRIRIETIKPNRMKAKIDFGTELLTKDKIRTPLKLSANWLHGSPAKNAEVKVLMTLKPNSTQFKKFENYQFLFPNSKYKTEEAEVFSGKTDNLGKTQFTLKVAAKGAPGMLDAQFLTRVFEKSGDFSIITQSVKYSPYNSYVGVKMSSDGQNGWYKTDTDHRLNVVNLNENGNPVAQNNIKVMLYKLSWRWWWNSYDDDLAAYVGRTSRSPVSTQYVSTNSEGKGSVNLKVDYHSYEDNGRYLIVVEDPKSGHKTGTIVYFSKWYGRLGGGAVGANMLSFNSDKDKYNICEEVHVNIPSSKNGRAMVSIESGSDIIDVFWVEAQENETRFSFKATKEMVPNVFIHISLLQPHAQSINDNPIRMYGVIPIEVEDEETKLRPKIQMAETLKPEKDFQIKVSEEDGKAMTYTLAIVDEGLLDITNFKTPNPWRRFFAKEAMGIRTWDMYDYVVGAYGARLEKAFAIGGDESAPDPSKNKARRFKPVVFYEGPFTLDKGETKKHELSMPNYIGSVRVMVIAGNQGAYGNAEKTVVVKKDLMLLATLPRVLGPKEEVVLPVTVFAMSDKVKNVDVQVETNDKLQLVDAKKNTTYFSSQGDQVVHFKLKAKDKIGKAKVRVTAKSDNITAHYEIELDVRTPNIPTSTVKDSLISAGEEWVIDVSPMGIEGTNSAVFEISGVPSMGLNWRMDQLLAYPHGCIEQTTSKILPQIFLPNLTELSTVERERAEENVMEGLNRLRNFQLANGGFSYWPGDDYISEWGTSYAGHMMLLAEREGFSLPSRMKMLWVNYQRSETNSWRDKQRFGGQLNQAYRLYTLALAGKAELGAMNRLSQSSNLNSRTRYMLALAYAELGKNQMAKKLIQEMNLPKEGGVNYLSDYTYGSPIRDKSIRLLYLSQVGDKETAFHLVKEISTIMDSRRWLSTQSMAFGLMAVNNYYSGQKPEGIKFKLDWDGKDNSFDSKTFVWKKELKMDSKKARPMRVKNESDGSLYMRLILKGTPIEGMEKEVSENLKMNLIYMDMEGKELDPVRIEQGTDFKAIVEIHNPGLLGNYSEMALTQVFPSGWEIINTRLLGLNNESSRSDYVDIRDDRVYTYFDIRERTTLRYVVILNAAYEGKFYLPAVNCSAMYDNSINAVKKGRWVEVYKQ